MEIRELTKTDLPSLLELYVQLDESNKNLSIKDSEKVWQQIEATQNLKYFGAVDGGKVVSTCYCLIIPNLTAMNKPICFVENVVTDKDYRKQGLAKKVIETAIEFARQHKCYKVILQSGIARKEAHQFYEKLGFNGNSKKAFDLRLKY